MANESKPTASVRDVLIRHIFRAPAHLVFKAWLSQEYLARWFAPDGCSVRFKKFDPREGGGFHLCISNPQYGDCWCVGEYRTIIENEKIVYLVTNTDENGCAVLPASIGMDPEWPGQTLVTVTFRETDGTTEMTLEQTVSETIAKRTGAHPSWIQMLNRLEKILS